MSALLDSLTDEQLEAATATAPDVILTAAAGAGKTRVLVARIVHLIESGVEPAEIVAFTFTRSACEEIRSRVAAEIGHHAARAITVTTFHAYAAAIVVPQGFRVATETEARVARDSVLKTRINGERNPVYVPGLCGVEKFEADLVEREAHLGLITREIKFVLSRLVDQRLFPTWDLLPLLLAYGVQLAPARHVLVDEAQDITRAEGLLLSRIPSPDGAPVHHFAVHDPRQAIMGWRGGIGVEALGWMKDPERLSLTRCFRFGPEIADVANRVAAAFGGDPIVGAGPAGTVTRALRADFARHETGLVLARTNLLASQAPRFFTGVKHVRRDPMDVFGRDADHFGETWASGYGVCSTVHSAKGREADCVLMMDHDDPRSQFPKRKDVEDLRVLYVAVTRARTRLCIGRLSPEGEAAIGLAEEAPAAYTQEDAPW